MLFATEVCSPCGVCAETLEIPVQEAERSPVTRVSVASHSKGRGPSYSYALFQL